MDFYYDSNGDVTFCNYGTEYTWDPAFWGVDTWNWYWSGYCSYGDESSDAEWWYDSWYWWADSEPEWYMDSEGDYTFCTYGNQYTWDPSFWNTEGWTWYWSDWCGDYSYDTWWYYDVTYYTWWPYYYDTWYYWNDSSS